MAESHTTQLILDENIFHGQGTSHSDSSLPGGYTDTASLWIEHNFPPYLPPPGVSPTQHACPGKAFTHEAQFAKFIVEPWAVMAGKEDKEGHRAEQRERE